MPAGVRVMQLCQPATGRFGGMLLAHPGTGSIAVEAQGGDGMRNRPPLTRHASHPVAPADAGSFASGNRNKRSVVLNLEHPGGLAAARDRDRVGLLG